MSATFDVPFSVTCNALGDVCLQHDLDEIEAFQKVRVSAPLCHIGCGVVVPPVKSYA